MKINLKVVSMTLKFALLGVMAFAYVACDTDKISYDEVFEHTSASYAKECNTFKRRSHSKYKDGEFMSPTELNRREKGLIGACVYKEYATDEDDEFRLYTLCLANYNLNRSKCYKEIQERRRKSKESLKKFCYASKEPREEEKTGFVKIDKDGSFLIDNKYKVLVIVESAEYNEKGYCTQKEIYKLVKKE